MLDTLSYLSLTDARRLAQRHMPRMPDEGRSQYRRRVALQAQKLQQIAERQPAAGVA